MLAIRIVRPGCKPRQPVSAECGAGVSRNYAELQSGISEGHQRNHHCDHEVGFECSWEGNLFGYGQGTNFTALDTFALVSKRRAPNANFIQTRHSSGTWRVAASAGLWCRDKLFMFASYETNIQDRANTVSFGTLPAASSGFGQNLSSIRTVGVIHLAVPQQPGVRKIDAAAIRKDVVRGLVLTASRNRHSGFWRRHQFSVGRKRAQRCKQRGRETYLCIWQQPAGNVAQLLARNMESVAGK